MKKLRIFLLAVAVAAITAITAGSALAKQSTVVAFVKGKGTLIGSGAITGHGTADSSQQPCIPFTGVGTIKGLYGVITYKVIPSSTACGDEGGHVFSVTTHLAIVKATGKLYRAKGVLKLTGIYSRDSGSFTVKVSGRLTKP